MYDNQIAEVLRKTYGDEKFKIYCEMQIERSRLVDIELQKLEGQKTALQLADEIEDEHEREEVKTLIQNRISPSGNPQADLVLARGEIGRAHV